MRIVVAGGGPAGMMAALRAAECGAEVTLLEQNEKLGKKLYITGKGRCNVTNDCAAEEVLAQVVSNPKFLYSSIYGFPPAELMALIESAGCPLKTERGGRVFPVSDHSSDVIRAMGRLLERAGVRVLLHTRLEGLRLSDGRTVSIRGGAAQGATTTKDSAIPAQAPGKAGVEYAREDSGEAAEAVRITAAQLTREGRAQTLPADAVILAGGGRSYAATGADGSLLRLAEALGHHLIPARPALVPFVIREESCRALQGLSLRNVAVSLSIGKKKLYEGFGEMLFTHYGVSGPLILSASSRYSRDYADEEALLTIDLKPALGAEQLDERLLREIAQNKKKQFGTLLRALAPGKLAEVLPGLVGIPAEKRSGELTREERLRLRDILKGLRFTVTGTRGFEEAIITSGGVSVREISASRMESKRVRGLYFAGEMIDVDAYTGGYNLQIAWATGRLAGESAAGE